MPVQFIPALLGAAKTAAPYLLSAGAGMLGNKARKSQDGTGGGFEVVTMPQYSFTEPRLRLISDFVSDNITRIGQGKRPAYYDNAVPYIRENLERPLRTTYFGRPGDRTGTVNAALEASAIMGTGPRSGTAQVNKALARYEDASKQIDEFIEKTGVDVTQEALRTSIYGGLSLPKGPDAQVVSYGGYGPQQTAGITDSLSSLVGNIPYLFDAMNKTKKNLYSEMPGGDQMFEGSNTYTPYLPPPPPPQPVNPSGQQESPNRFSNYLTNAEQMIKMLRGFTNPGYMSGGFI